MSKPRLVIDEKHYDFIISWYFPDDGDTGAILGEDTYPDLANALVKSKCEDHDHIIATHVAGKSKGVSHHNRAYRWETISDARAALREIKAALQAAASKVPWPEWAVKAKAAGWKAPKSWKP